MFARVQRDRCRRRGRANIYPAARTQPDAERLVKPRSAAAQGWRGFLWGIFRSGGTSDSSVARRSDDTRDDAGRSQEEPRAFDVGTPPCPPKKANLPLQLRRVGQRRGALVAFPLLFRFPSRPLLRRGGRLRRPAPARPAAVGDQRAKRLEVQVRPRPRVPADLRPCERRVSARFGGVGRPLGRVSAVLTDSCSVGMPSS